MDDLKSGMLIRHASLGLGKVVAVESHAVHVFFDGSETRFATKLRLPMAAPLLSRSDDANAWLEATSPFTRDAKSGRYALAQTWVAPREAMARFGEAFPNGFAGGEGAGGDLHERANRWRAANAAWEELLGGGAGEKLLEDGELAELARRALRVEKPIAALHPPSDRPALAQALQDPSATGDFFAALFAQLAAAPSKARFEALAAAALALPRSSPGAAWVTATILPAIAQPARHALLRPRGTCDAAHRLGLDVKYDADPNWRTYGALLGISQLLLETLRPNGARDFVDVESFVHAARAPRTAQ